MASDFRAFWLARRGNSPEEYEDAFAADVAAGRYAVADGATESSFADLWARMLVDQFVQNAECDLGEWTGSLPALQERWYADVRGRPLPWYAEAQLEEGAFAAFLGLVLTASPDSGHLWQAVAVGDSCLFHIRGADLLGAFPLDESGQFDNFPTLVGSHTSPEVIREKRTLRTQGSGLPDDEIWMMTDALAQWCLKEHELGRNPWAEIHSLLAPSETKDRFTSWVEELRDTRQLHNDDVTLLAVKL